MEPATPIRLDGDRLILLDQTKLPEDVEYLQIHTVDEVWRAIREMRVRGAPAIGITAAFGVYLAARGAAEGDPRREGTGRDLSEAVFAAAGRLRTARPTAVNLFFALDRMLSRAGQAVNLTRQAFVASLRDEALALQREEEASCRTMGEHLLTLMHDGMGALTHCNAGALATGRYGTALAGFYLAKERGWNVRVYADETRPVLQGARLTAWELGQAGIDVTLLCDNMAASVMAQGKIDAVMVGADRIAANGDTANKIGTYGVAVLARHFGIPFYVAAPRTTIDLGAPDGGAIPIEMRPPEEVVSGLGRRIAPDGVEVYNPAFDVTPHQLVTAIVTEAGIVRPPFDEGLSLLFGRQP